MTLLIAEGFDDGMYKERALLKGGYCNATASETYGRDGKGIRVGDAVSHWWRLRMSSVAGYTVTMGAHIRISSGGGVYLFGLSASSSTFGYSTSYLHAVVRVTDSRFGVVDRTGTVYADYGTFQQDVWYYLELQVHADDAPNGWWELRSDGVTIASATGRDTFSSTLYLLLGGTDSDDRDYIHVDNLYVVDDQGTGHNDFLGICRVDTLIPDGNGATTDWTGSDGNQTDNYLLVDDASVTTDYVAAATEGDVDTYALPALAGTEDVLGVVTTVVATKSDSGAKFVRPVSRSGGVDYPGESVGLNEAAYLAALQTMEEDPSTSAAWSIAGVNALEAGAEVRDS